jgi:hypothetical protein
MTMNVIGRMLLHLLLLLVDPLLFVLLIMLRYYSIQDVMTNHQMYPEREKGIKKLEQGHNAEKSDSMCETYR